MKKYSTICFALLVFSLGMTACSTSNNTPAQAPPTESKASMYKPGTYEGTARGREPGLQVSVTVAQDKIEEIKIGTNKETTQFINSARDAIIPQIIEKQSTEVDTVVGATQSSEGIIKAVEEALQLAKN